ncbi:MAG: translocation/assembly module TamB domain-containing protein [Saprospiraceae bacterium]|nr:translocation/assembly module TamB [Saprospiraceae bacterium]MDW8229802.1 translocation/assembly module TamB domain-containing protein [Saprospiraceae bacterium]
MSELPSLPPSPEEAPRPEPPQARSWQRRVWGAVEKALFWSISLLIALGFILQFPPVQNWLVDRVSSALSKAWKAEVSVGYVYLSLVDGVQLSRLYVSDQQGDTLLYAGVLEAGLRDGLWSVLGGRLEFDEIDIEQARFFLRRREGEEALNLQFILDHFAPSEPPKPDKEPSSFRLGVRHLHLRDVHFLLDDRAVGQRMEAYLHEGILQVDEFSPGQQRLRVRRLALDGASFSIAEYEAAPPTKSAAKPVAQMPPDTATSKPLHIFVGQMLVQNSRFALDRFDASPARHALEGVIDFEHLHVSDIAVEADSVTASTDLVFGGQLRRLQAREQSGFVLEHLSAQQVHVSDTLTALYGMRLQTNGSLLTDTLSLRYRTYRDFERFTDRVYMDGRLAEGSRVRLGDIVFFSPDLKTNTFFAHNRDLTADISGWVYGRVNSLNGRNLFLRAGNDLMLRGKFDGDDLAEGSDRLRLLFDLDEARTNLVALRRILPDFKPPAYFNTLGNVRFRGYYHLLFGVNHILAGSLTSDVGYGRLDMKLDLGGGQERAVYSGFLEMHDFNLAAWTGDSQFGLASFNFKIAEGTGLTLNTIRTRASGVIDSLYFRGYNYHNIELDGRFEQAVFKGRAEMDDRNIAFSFDGAVSLKDSTPEFDFKADIRHIDLCELNLVERDWILSGKVQQLKLYAPDWDNLYGAVVLRHFRLEEYGQVYRLDSLTFGASTNTRGQRRFILFSDVLDGSLSGRFTVNRLWTNLLTVLQRHYPALVQQALGKSLPDTVAIDDNYQVKLRIKDTRNLLQLFVPELAPIQNAQFDARVNAPQGQIDLRASAPSVRYGEAEAYQPEVLWRVNRDNGRLKVDLPWANLSPKRPLGHFSLEGDLSAERIDFLFSAEDTTSVVERLFLKGELSTADSMWNVHFNTASLTLFDERWEMEEDNYVRFRRGYWEARNIYLMHDLKRVLLESHNNGRGLRFALANFDLRFFERILPLENIAYRGNIFNLDGEVEDIFEWKNLQAYITTDTVFLNEKPFGALSGFAEMADLNAPLLALLYLKDREKHELRLLAGFLPNSDAPIHVNSELGEIRPGEFQASVRARAFPLGVLELIVPDISKTSGTLDARIDVGGPLDRVQVNGEAWADGQFQLDYLKALFYLPRERIVLTHDRIWADGDTLLDATRRNVAIVSGGLRHNHFQNWQVDCRIRSVSPNFHILNTRQGDNDLFYGQAMGNFDATFKGSLDKVDIRIDATAGRDTRLYIPVGATNADVQEIRFITFQNARPTTADSADSRRRPRPDVLGLSLEMNLTLTEEAEVQLIFDAQAGDIIKGRGSGDIRMVITREGDFNMYGTYRILRGEYLFTLLNWVNKPFTVEEGGTITWYGDPFGAQINLKAVYSENTSLTNLIRDELVTAPGLTSEANRPTRTVVTMHLRGDLFKPTIGFDLAFPNIVGQLKSLTDSKLALLRQDQNELTRQVFGLVVVGSFLPPSTAAGLIQGGDYMASAFNTLTQMLSSQLTNYLNELASEWVGGSLSSIEFDIIYNEYRSQLNPDQQAVSGIGRDLQVRLTSGFKDDRITLQVGSQFGVARPGTAATEAFVGGDVAVEIQFTQNRHWRLRVYHRTEPDIAGGARRSRSGGGVVFRKEFDTFGELMEGLTGWMRTRKNAS